MTRKEIMFAGGIHGVHDFMPGMPKSLMPQYKPGELMPDTLIALQLADSLAEMKGKFTPDDFKKRLATLLESEEFLESAPAAHCLLPLRKTCAETNGHGNSGENPAPTAAEAPPEFNYDAVHVGAAARAFPIGCLPEATNVIEIAVKQAELSHCDGRVGAAAAVLAHAVRRFVTGTKIDTEETVRTFVKEHFDIARTLAPRFADAWDDVAPDLDYVQPAEELPYSLINVDSDVNEAVPTAVGIFLIFRHDLEEAISAAASSGGDTDTVAAIVGALSGAYHGASAIPERWLNQISQRDRLEQVADRLIALWK